MIAVRRVVPALLMAACSLAILHAQTLPAASTQDSSTALLGHADQGDGTYRNPILCADYSDPDVIRVGDDYYLTASSFTSFPGLPILHSRDLVTWDIIGYAIPHYPNQGYGHHVSGGGVWAPAIRYHNGEFYIFFADPDVGIYMTHAKDPAKEWSPLTLVHKGGGWIDPCPFWDEDGKAYLIHGFAASRANGLNNVLCIAGMSADGTHLLDEGKLTIDGKALHLTTLEGPKLYKRNGYYYVLAPAGGVAWGYQMAFRSKTIGGPYEARLMMHQGETSINGPHQGGWVTTQTGEEWFIHFQDRGAFGRIIHLEPMQWVNDWPIAGDTRGETDPDRMVGTPVAKWKKPNVGNAATETSSHGLPNTDEFDSTTLGLQWQWFSDWKPSWYSLTEKPGSLRLKPVIRDANEPLFLNPNLLLQKLPAERFTLTTKLDVSSFPAGASAGLVVVGDGTLALRVKVSDREIEVEQTVANPFSKASKSGHATDDPPLYQPAVAIVAPQASLMGNRSNTGSTQSPVADITKDSTYLQGRTVYLRVEVFAEKNVQIPRAICNTSVSSDGEHFKQLGDTVDISDYGWIGAKIGLFCNATTNTFNENVPTPTTMYGEAPTVSKGFVDVDWFRFSPLAASQE